MIRFKPEWKVPLGIAGVGIGSFIMGGVAGYLFRGLRLSEGDVEEDEPDGEQLQFQFDFAQNELFERMDRKVNDVIRVVEGLKEYLDIQNETRVDEIARDMHAHVVYHDPPDAVIVEDEWDYEVEMRNRSEERPYTIHQEEYMADEKGYNQVTLTYYAGDDVLCDEQMVPIYNPETIVGALKFGHGSGDGMLVYVRNDKLEAEYEIQLEPAKYAVMVLGAQAEEDILDDEVKHGNAIHKFKKD
jgi:hypothetical protein